MTEFIPFRPALHGPFATRFYDQARQLVEICKDKNGKLSLQAEELIEGEVDWAVSEMSVNPQQRRVYRAVWYVLRDLLHVGWSVRWQSEILQIAPPQIAEKAYTIEQMKAEKEFVRFAMARAREMKIAEAKEFIQRVENPSVAATAEVSITRLIADGHMLAAELRSIKQLPTRDQQIAALRTTVKPYLQLVTENERCQYTGHKLADIWRYFRYTWTVPAESTPGRTLHYLVRDAAHPFHPIIGIGSLENSVIRSPKRDHELGWSTKNFRERVMSAPNIEAVRGCFEELIRNIQASISEVNLEGLCKPQDIAYPDRKLIRHLRDVAVRAAEDRKVALRRWEQFKKDNTGTFQKSLFGDISVEAEDALYTAKRATRLHKLFVAQLAIQDLLNSPNFENEWAKFAASEDNRPIIRTAIRAVKGRHVGTSIMELNVCGAIPPYNELLGGKLVALLMISPKVVVDYRERYGNRPSDIATRMKGEAVVRPAELVFVGTTSLYSIGASQYNRLKLPSGLLKLKAHEVKWRELGVTGGYGTLHISNQTLRSLEEASGGTFVNNVFGEGASPKLRALRQALSVVLDLDQRHSSVEITKHSMSRLIYGAFLASNAVDFLNGRTQHPQYYFDPQGNAIDQTEQIAEYWRERWLLTRLDHEESLLRIEQFDIERFALGAEIERLDAQSFTPISDEVNSMNQDNETDENGRSWRDFVMGLYRGTSAYSDQIDIGLLDKLHVETDLDKAVLAAVSQGKTILLTGNPGDGKTHLLRMMEKRLMRLQSKPVLEYDASALTDEQLLEKWQTALSQNRPFCLAINEAVLNSLSRLEIQPQWRDAQIQAQLAQEQVEKAVVYSETETSLFIDAPLFVFDLSRRNVLDSEVVGRAMDKLADPNRMGLCGQDENDLTVNLRLIQHPMFRERLQAIFNRVSQRGYHATLREVQAFISYMLFAGRSCREIQQNSGDFEKSLPQLPFEGKGSLFRAAKKAFDPAGISHPMWDEALVTAQTVADDWLDDYRHWYSVTEALKIDDVKHFQQRKRAFYFFHLNGDELLSMAGDDEADFAVLLTSVQSSNENKRRDALRFVVRRVNSFFGDIGVQQIRVWQSHRYDQSPRKILYSALTRRLRDFELVYPRLQRTMQQGFELALDHVLLRLKGEPAAKLRIDFALFELLAQAERGVPVIAIDNDLTRRLWQFMEQLTEPIDVEETPEVEVAIFDLTSGDKLLVKVDIENLQYLELKRENL